MKTFAPFFLATALALTLGPVQAADSPAEAKADAARLKKLNACNKKVKGLKDADYQKAMDECMAKRP
jgi:hypothetical protein